VKFGGLIFHRRVPSRLFFSAFFSFSSSCLALISLLKFASSFESVFTFRRLTRKLLVFRALSPLFSPSVPFFSFRVPKGHLSESLVFPLFTHPNLVHFSSFTSLKVRPPFSLGSPTASLQLHQSPVSDRFGQDT